MRVALKEEYARRARFIMGVSHDLRTPLTLIQGYVEAISDGYAAEPEAQKKYLSIILDKTRALEGMIGDLIEFVRMETGPVADDPPRRARPRASPGPRAPVLGGRPHPQAGLRLDRRASRGGERPHGRGPFHAGAGEPRRQRHPLHRAEGEDRHGRAGTGRPGAPRHHGHRHRDPGRGPLPDLRSVLPRHQLPARAGIRPRAHHGEVHHREPRVEHRRVVRGRRGHDVHHPDAAHGPGAAA